MFRFSAAVVATIILVASSFVFGQTIAQPATPMSMTSASGQSGAEQPSITGTISYRERVALPSDAAIDVKLLDVATPGAVPKTIAENIFSPGGQQVPIPFQLPYNPADINPEHAYQLAANISVNGKPMFASTIAYPVITQGAPSQVVVILQPAPAQPKQASTTQLYGTDWRLVELNGAAVAPVEGKSAHLVLHKKGTISGFTGCNSLMGSYIAEQGAMQFTPGATTANACAQPLMQQEQAFLLALKATTKYQLSGGSLELLNGEQVLAKFEVTPKK